MLQRVSKVFSFAIIILAILILPAANFLYTAKAVSLSTPITFAGTTSFATASGTPPSAIVTQHMRCSLSSCGASSGGQDIVTADGASGTVSVYANNGDNTFTGHSYKTCYPSQPCATTGSQNGANVLDVAVGDFNGDGLADVAAAVTVPGASDEVVVWLNQGAGVLGAPSITPMPWGARSVVANNLGESHTDLVVGSTGQWAAVGAPFTGDAIQVLHGKGDGTFQNLATTDIYEYGTFRDWYGGSYSKMILADLGNGHLDIVALDNQCNGNDWGHYDVYLGDGSGHFTTTASEIATTCTVGTFSLSDFNGDGKLDIVGVQRNGPFTNEYLDIRPGNGDGTFGLNPVTTPVNPVGAVVSGDFNGDTYADAVFIAGNGVDAYAGHGDGTLNAAGTTATPPNPSTIATGILNQTGITQDIIIGSSGDSSLTPPVVPELTVLWNAPTNLVPNSPQQVTNAANAVGNVGVSWVAPEANGAVIDHYDIEDIHTDNSVGSVQGSVPGNRTSWLSGKLNLCEFYRFGVVAVSAQGQRSTVAYPAKAVLTQGLPQSPPNSVVILLNGVKTSIGSASYNPLLPTYCAGITQSNGGITDNTGADPTPLGDMINNWAQNAGYGAGNRMTDTLASSGAVLLPFSYNDKGAILSGSPTAPTFNFHGYGPQDVSSKTPPVAAVLLQKEVQSIVKVWPNTHIYILGHSEGGNVAFTWWRDNVIATHNPNNMPNVVHVWSLDSPINGFGFVEQLCTNIDCSGITGAGHTLSTYFKKMWGLKVLLDIPFSKANAFAGNRFTPVGTVGDPLYDAGDRLNAPVGSTPIGLISQVFVGKNCIESRGYNATDCAPIGTSVQDSCGPLPDDTLYGPPLYGLPAASLYMHSVVENCPGVISLVSSAIK